MHDSPTSLPARPLLELAETVFAGFGQSSEHAPSARKRLLDAGALAEDLPAPTSAVRAMRSLGFDVRQLDSAVPVRLLRGSRDVVAWIGWSEQHAACEVFARSTTDEWERWDLVSGTREPVSIRRARMTSVSHAWVVRQPSVQPGSTGKGDSAWRRLWGLVQWDRGDLFALVMFAFFIGLLSLGTPLASQALVGSIAFATNTQMVFVLAIVLAIAMVVSAVLQALEIRVVEALQQRMLLRVVDRLSATLPRMQRFGLGAYGPSLISRFYDIFIIQKSASWLFLEGLRLVVSAFVGMVLLATYHPILLAFDTVIVVFVLVVLFGLGRRGLQTAVEESNAKHHLFDSLHEVGTVPDQFQGAEALESIRSRLDHSARHWLVERRRQFNVVFTQAVGALLLQALTLSLLLAIGGYLVIEGQLTLGQLVAAELAVAAIVYPVAKLSMYVETVYDMYAASYKLGKLTDVEPLGNGLATWSTNTAQNAASLVIVNPRLGLPSGEAAWASTVDVNLEPGARALIVGREASGKTLLMDALAGRLPVTGGRLEIDGLDVREVEPDAWRSAVATVTASLVCGDLMENIQTGRASATSESIREILRSFGCDALLSRLGPGNHRALNPALAPLSATELLLVGFARAMAGRPRLLLVDGMLERLPRSYRDRVGQRLFATDAPWSLVIATHDEGWAERCTSTIELVRA
jgi:ABC-type bacteriocin/lantibiotic exporter with double-glycine peptidase domain